MPKTENVFYYTSRELESETGDYYYRARYYDPSTGRFLSEDPIGFAGRDVNLYRYVQNNPMRFKDAFGLKQQAGNSEGDLPNPWDEMLGTLKDFWDNYMDMRKRGGDKYHHCMANCEATKRGNIGGEFAQFISNTREYTDSKFKGNSSSDCEADERANFRGQMAGAGGDNCAAVCAGAQ